MRVDQDLLITNTNDVLMQRGRRGGGGGETPATQEEDQEPRDAAQPILEEEEKVPLMWSATLPARGHRKTTGKKASQPTATIQTNGVSSKTKRAGSISITHGIPQTTQCEAVDVKEHVPHRTRRPVGAKAAEKTGIRKEKRKREDGTRDEEMARCPKHRCVQEHRSEERDLRKTNESPSRQLHQTKPVERLRVGDWGLTSQQDSDGMGNEGRQTCSPTQSGGMEMVEPDKNDSQPMRKKAAQVRPKQGA